MYKRQVKFVPGILAVLFFMLPAVGAAEDSPPPLAEMWIVTPKADHGTEFYKAIGEHMAFRSEHGDPREWQAYNPLLGDELNRLAIRYCCFNWADQDGYQEWEEQAEEISAHFNEHVAPHAENWEHVFETMEWEQSHWPDDDSQFNLFAVTEFYVKPGEAAEFKAARDQILQIALNQGWATDDRAWLWASTIGGKPHQSIIIPHKNYASMDRGEESFSSFLAKHMGDEASAALLKQFSSSTRGSNFQIWVRQEEYSMSSGD
jgi:hypothetical protein